MSTVNASVFRAAELITNGTEDGSAQCPAGDEDSLRDTAEIFKASASTPGESAFDGVVACENEKLLIEAIETTTLPRPRRKRTNGSC
jgi:hypothetical protein